MMIIDSHCHLDHENSPEKMIQAMDAGGVDQIVLFAAACENLPSVPKSLLWFGRTVLRSPFRNIAVSIYEDAVMSRPGKIKVSGRFHQIHARPDNKPVSEAMKQYPDRFIGFVFLNPKDNPNVMAELELGVREYKMRGVKVHPWFHDYDPGAMLQDVAAKCQELNLPILMHLGSRPETSNIQNLVTRFPRLNFILAHLGIPWFQKTWAMARDLPNIYLDISGPYLSKSIVAKAVKTIGPDKLIYGTDAPYGLRTTRPGELSYADSRSWVDSLPISEKKKERIFSGNILSLIRS
jgi:predicted TIM-barrel fold metal-dependent hydrolase